MDIILKEIVAIIKEETEKIYANLSSWQKVLVARHPNRPHTIDYIANVFDGFEEMHGDRLNDDDLAMKLIDLSQKTGDPHYGSYRYGKIIQVN